MDYAFAPNTDVFDELLRSYFEVRPNTTLVDRRGVSTAEEFSSYLRTNPTVNRPIDNVLLGSHANRFSLYLLLTRQIGSPTTYEDVETVIREKPGAIRFPQTLFNTNTENNIHVRGCNVGKSTPFLLKLKEAFGNHANVTAPKHYNGIQTLPGQGVLEFMAYEFDVFRRQPFADRFELVEAFRARNHQFIDGSPVPKGFWNPKLPRRATSLTQEVGIGKRLQLAQSIGGRQTLVPKDIRFVPRPRASHSIDIGYPNEYPQDERQFFEDGIQLFPFFDANHPFPQWVRFGYDNLQDYLDGHTLTFGRAPDETEQGGDSNANTMRTTLTRAEYVLQIPIADPQSERLLFNFYPNVNNLTPIVLLSESDSRFFGRV